MRVREQQPEQLATRVPGRARDRHPKNHVHDYGFPCKVTQTRGVFYARKQEHDPLLSPRIRA
ncbi:hypothetical protein GCM10009593_44250 [Microlunatus antarcticus]